MSTNTSGGAKNANLDISWMPQLDHFSTVVKQEAEKLFKHIADSQEHLINERNDLQNEINLLRKEKADMTQLLNKYDRIVTLNVGGQQFSTTIETLTKEECLFTAMFSGRYDLPKYQDAIFIDRDPTHFRVLLNYLRTSTFIEPKCIQDRTELLLEAEYYQIKSLIKQLNVETDVNVIISENLFFHRTLHHPKVVISNDGLTASSSCVCEKYLFASVDNAVWKNGKHYWEIIKESESGTGCYSSMGIATSAWNRDQRLGDDSYSWTLRLFGKNSDYSFTGVRHDGKSTSYYDQFPKGTRIGALLDLNQGTLEYVINGEKKGIAFTNLKGHAVTPVFEFCHQTTFRMNHNATLPAN